MAEYDVFAEITEEFGEPDNAVTISAEEATRYRGRVPDALVRFWQTHGRGSYRAERFTMCDPQDFISIIRTVLICDSEFHFEDFEVIGYNQYGNLTCWAESGNYVNRDVLQVYFDRMTVFSPDTGREIDGSRSTRPPSSSNFGVGIQLRIGITSEDLHVSDNGEDLGVVARRVIGPLRPGEIYGFFPALAFGGEARVENMRRVGVVEHLTFLSQLGPFTLHDLTPPKPGFPYGETISVRQIGPSVP